LRIRLAAIGGAIERGRAVYEQNCATQHGAFPAERVEATLKGTDQTKAHTPAMTAWKALFLADANGNETTADERVKGAAAFIASLQAK
jgi:hypothetical protein